MKSRPGRERISAAWLSAAALMLLGALEGGTAVAQPAATAYVTSERDGAVRGVDTRSGRIVQEIEVGGRPHNLDMTPDGLLVIATQGTDTVAVVNPRTNPAKVRRIPLRVPPHDVAIGPDGHTAFVVSERGLLARLDPSGWRVVSRTEVRGRPHDVTVSRGAAWITDISARRLFAADEAGVHEVPISIEGHDLAVRPGSNELWVTPWHGESTVIVDLDTQREIASLRAGRTPSHKHLAFTADGGEAWITEPESGRIFVVDARTRQVVADIDLKGSPHHIRLAAGRAYVAAGPRDLDVLDVRSRTIIDRVRAGSEVHDVALQPAR
ncbi:hypothetical protein [Inquilinus sp. Marseille-Q2685]|uniref:hypothetical protein n=1 Tax=Inquilinus sp. Marseille-Q2685 TaxID=2866581 RepID=UPI001CE47126|nr:hypothetical protein [Inquilinus sp. Marseille-Q2685]